MFKSSFRNAPVLMEAAPDSTVDSASDFDQQMVRWHYSVHFHAESRGEEVIENLLSLTNSKRQRALLNAQLRDEAEHTRLFRKITNKVGLDISAVGYANAYAELVKAQKSLAEKVFVFQIITEAASAAYCEWRLLALRGGQFAGVDKLVREDESRHLLMGQSMLRICDRDEVVQSLTKSRRTELLRSMNEVCKWVKENEFLGSTSGARQATPPAMTLLDKMISRSVLREARAVDQILDSSIAPEEVHT